MMKFIFFTMILHTTVYCADNVNSMSSIAEQLSKSPIIAKQLKTSGICNKLSIEDGDDKKYKTVAVSPTLKNSGITNILLYENEVNETQNDNEEKTNILPNDNEVKTTQTVGMIALNGENVYGCSIFTRRPKTTIRHEYEDWELEYGKIENSLEHKKISNSKDQGQFPEFPIIELIKLNLEEIPEKFHEGGDFFYYTSVTPDNNYPSHKISLKLSLIPHCDAESEKLRYSNSVGKPTEEKLKSLYDGRMLYGESFEKLVKDALDSCDPERKIPKSLPEKQLLSEQELAEELPFSGTLNDSSDSSR
ncbi:MAG: hypothetical protein KF798_05825 [Candidatus Paracaedibacteraceae bacterium]|nr:hypothetical protein [Candidatus Paracaedibacteraceae bacterium]